MSDDDKILMRVDGHGVAVPRALLRHVQRMYFFVYLAGCKQKKRRDAADRAFVSWAGRFTTAGALKIKLCNLSNRGVSRYTYLECLR